jgi:hypothetical protein
MVVARKFAGFQNFSKALPSRSIARVQDSTIFSGWVANVQLLVHQQKQASKNNSTIS